MGLIERIIERNGYLDEISVHRHLKDIIGYQAMVRKSFRGIPEGIWEIMNFHSHIWLVCLDKDEKPLRFNT